MKMMAKKKKSWWQRYRVFRSLRFPEIPPPAEEHSFTLDEHACLAVISLTIHGYTGWIALLNDEAGPTKQELKGLGEWNRPVRDDLACRLPLEAALAWLNSHEYDEHSRSDDARVAYLTLASRADRSDQEVVVFYRSRRVIEANPVNELIDALDSASKMHLLVGSSAECESP